MVARYAEYQNMDVTAGGMAMQEMADYDAIPDWALSGMSICFYNGILSGKPGNLLDPNGTAVRTELAVILMNYAKLEPSGTVETDAYTATTVSIPNGDRQVPAVVTIPKGEGPFPAVVMNHGHGGSKMRTWVSAAWPPLWPRRALPPSAWTSPAAVIPPRLLRRIRSPT